MATYQINHSCGHEITHQLYGKHTERERRIAWLETTLCPACYRDEQERKHQAENEQAAARVAELGFPQLTGSEKQVAWANTIRQSKYDELCKIRPQQVWADLMREALSLESRAKFWIDSRDYAGTEILRELNNIHPAEIKEMNERAQEIIRAQEAGDAVAR